MLRIILRLFGIKDFEPCKSCEILKQQLNFVNDEKRQLTETLIKIVNPKMIESAPLEFSPITNGSALFSKRRAALEAKDREEARIKQQSTNLGRPDALNAVRNIESLEKELGIQEEGKA